MLFTTALTSPTPTHRFPSEEPEFPSLGNLYTCQRICPVGSGKKAVLLPAGFAAFTTSFRCLFPPLGSARATPLPLVKELSDRYGAVVKPPSQGEGR